MKSNKINSSGINAASLVFFIAFLSIFSAVESKNICLSDSLNTAQPVYFDYGSSVLKPESHDILNMIAEELNSNSGLTLYITGYTDDRGSEIFNLTLSEKRADAVKDYLLSKGCNSDNIVTYAKGKNEPVNENKNDMERALNRRVEFNLIYKESKNVQIPDDITYLNSSLIQYSRNEVKGELSVRDTSGNPIEGIKEEDVSAVLKWKTNEQKDSASGKVKFLPIDDKKKVAYTFTMDYSPSMYNDRFEKNAPKTEKILAMESAVQKFIETMDDKNIAKIIKFGRVINVMQSFTKSKDALRKAITSGCYPREGTALFKSIYEALCDAAFENNPTVMKTVIAFTDGEENSSGNINKDSIYRLSELKGIKVYTVGLLEEFKHSIPFGLRGTGEADLSEIAAKTGGFYWWAAKSADLPAIYTSILNQILKSYQISIMWNEEKLPPKGTKVTAVLRVIVKGNVRTLYKEYVME